MSKELEEVLGTSTPKVVKERHEKLKEETGDSSVDWERAFATYRKEANDSTRHPESEFPMTYSE